MDLTDRQLLIKMPVNSHKKKNLQRQPRGFAQILLCRFGTAVDGGQSLGGLDPDMRKSVGMKANEVKNLFAEKIRQKEEIKLFLEMKQQKEREREAKLLLKEKENIA